MPSLPNEGDAVTRPGVEGNEAIALRHVQDAFLFPVGPVRQSPLPDSCRGAAAPRAPSSSLWTHFNSPVAASSDDDRPTGTRSRVQSAANHERRGLEIELEARTEVIGLEPPGHFELAEVGRGDLIERRNSACARGHRRRFATRLSARQPVPAPMPCVHEATTTARTKRTNPQPS